MKKENFLKLWKMIQKTWTTSAFEYWVIRENPYWIETLLKLNDGQVEQVLKTNDADLREVLLALYIHESSFPEQFVVKLHQMIEEQNQNASLVLEMLFIPELKEKMGISLINVLEKIDSKSTRNHIYDLFKCKPNLLEQSDILDILEIMLKAEKENPHLVADLCAIVSDQFILEHYDVMKIISLIMNCASNAIQESVICAARNEALVQNPNYMKFLEMFATLEYEFQAINVKALLQEDSILELDDVLVTEILAYLVHQKNEKISDIFLDIITDEVVLKTCTVPIIFPILKEIQDADIMDEFWNIAYDIKVLNSPYVETILKMASRIRNKEILEVFSETLCDITLDAPMTVPYLERIAQASSVEYAQLLQALSPHFEMYSQSISLELLDTLKYIDNHSAIYFKDFLKKAEWQHFAALPRVISFVLRMSNSEELQYILETLSSYDFSDDDFVKEYIQNISCSTTPEETLLLKRRFLAELKTAKATRKPLPETLQIPPKYILLVDALEEESYLFHTNLEQAFAEVSKEEEITPHTLIKI